MQFKWAQQCNEDTPKCFRIDTEATLDTEVIHRYQNIHRCQIIHRPQIWAFDTSKSFRIDT